MLNKFRNKDWIFMLFAKIIASGTPILIIEILRRNFNSDLVGFYQNTISVLEILIAILLFGTGQFFIKNKTKLKVVVNFFYVITLIMFIMSFNIFNNYLQAFLFIFIATGLRFYSSYYLSRKKYVLASILNNNLLIFLTILFGLLFLSDFTETFLKNIFLVSKSFELKNLILILFFAFFSIVILKETYTFYLPRVLSIIQSNIDMVILPLYIDFEIFAAYVVLTRWSKLISFPLTIGINYFLPIYREVINDKQRKLSMYKKYFNISAPYSILSGFAVTLYLSYSSEYHLIYIIIAVFTSILNLIFGPLGIPIIQGNNLSRISMTLYSLIEGILFILIIILFQHNLLTLLIIFFIRMIMFNSWKFYYVKKKLW